MKILVYGATGRLGKMVARALRSEGHRLRLSGRDEQRLKAVAELGDEITTAPLAHQMRDVTVVANCAPLNTEDTDELILAALEAGCHYADLTGEQAAINHIFLTFDDRARKAGVCVIPALGLDYAVGDCLAHLAAAGHPCNEITIAYAFEGAEAADNSMDHATSGPRGDEVVYRNGNWKKVPFELDLGWFRYPHPIGRQQVGRYGSGEVVTVPRHTQANTIRTYITASSLVPHPFLLPFFPLLRPLVAWALRTPLRHVIRQLGALLARLRPKVAVTPSAVPAQGPSFLVVVEAQSPENGKTRIVAGGRDCHRTTAEILARGVSLLAGGKGLACGVLSAAQAFEAEAFLNELGDCLSWWTE